MSGEQDGRIGYDVDGAVATITIDRPAARGALTTSLKEQLLAAAERAAGDDAVRAVLLTGAGPAFCAGQDLREHADHLASGDPAPLATVDRHYNPLVRAITSAPKPVVAAVPGTCAGAGLALALACDLRLAAAGARFATAFTGIGLTTDSGLSWTLPRVAGRGLASRLLLLGEAFTAEQALAWGVVDAVHPDDELAAAARALVERLADGPTAAYAATKQALLAGAEGGLDEALALESRLQSGLGATGDHRGAVTAFLAKQRPVFRGR